MLRGHLTVFGVPMRILRCAEIVKNIALVRFGIDSRNQKPREKSGDP